MEYNVTVHYPSDGQIKMLQDRVEAETPEEAVLKLDPEFHERTGPHVVARIFAEGRLLTMWPKTYAR